MTQTGKRPDQYDLFVSYAHSDDRSGWVSALVEGIRQEHAQFTPRPLAVFFDRQDIRAMDDWEHRILHGLRSSKTMIAVLSPQYFVSLYCRKEWEEFLEHELARCMPGEGIAPIYIVTAPQLEQPHAGQALEDWLAGIRRRQYLDLREWHPHGVAALRKEEVRERLQELEHDLAQRIDRVERARDSTSTVPGANPNFVGRIEELRRLRELLAMHQVGAVTAVHGIGGIGKSALAFQYAQAFAHEYPGGRFLVDTARTSDLRVPIVNLAPHLGITLSEAEQKDLNAAYARVRATLEQRPTCLLLLDNVDDGGLLAPSQRARCLPAGERVHVLVTTRLEPAKLTGLECLALDALAESDALKLLERYRPIDSDTEWKAAQRIVHRLGGHALAVEVVAVYLWKNPEIGYADYLVRLEEEGLAALDAAGEDPEVQIRHLEKLLGRLLGPTLQGLSSAELLVLEYAAVLPPDRVALPWLRELAGRTIPELVAPPRPGYPDPWNRLVRRLGGLQFFRETDDSRVVRVHRLVQDVVCARMGAGRREEFQKEVTAIAGQRAEFLKEGWVHRENRWELEPLRDYVLRKMHLADVDASSLASDIAEPFWHMACYNEARELLRRAIAIQEKVFGPDHPNLAGFYNNLALLEHYLGNLTDARELLQRAIAVGEKAMEPDYPTLAIRYSNLAMVESDIGNLIEARNLARRAIDIQEKIFQPDHPNLAIRYSNLADVELNLGNLIEARDLLRRALTIQEKVFKPDHPRLAKAYYNLGTVETNLGNLSEARDLLHRAIAVGEKVFEPDHPDHATHYSILARVEQGLGNLTEAQELLRRAIAIQEKAFEPDHTAVATSYSLLATVENDLGSLTEARCLMRRACQIRRSRLGEQHPDTKASWQWLVANDPDFSDE
jgi:tetratricopeptide (TPR) repeat protein